MGDVKISTVLTTTNAYMFFEIGLPAHRNYRSPLHKDYTQKALSVAQISNNGYTSNTTHRAHNFKS